MRNPFESWRDARREAIESETAVARSAGDLAMNLRSPYGQPTDLGSFVEKYGTGRHAIDPVVKTNDRIRIDGMAEISPRVANEERKRLRQLGIVERRAEGIGRVVVEQGKEREIRVLANEIDPFSDEGQELVAFDPVAYARGERDLLDLLMHND
jgi:hypothetical protein